MTFSLIALEPDERCLGVACATGGPAVGGFVPHLWPGVGAAITQGYSTHVLAAEEGLARLSAGDPVTEVAEALQVADRGSAWRQLALMDIQGRAAGWTGEHNVPVMDMHLSQGLVVAGNMLASSRVVPAMVSAYLDAKHCGVTLADALIAALLAGYAAGGDQRGVLSAALKVRAPGGVPYDLRIDHAENAVEALAHLHRRVTEDDDHQEFLSRLPDASNPHQY